MRILNYKPLTFPMYYFIREIFSLHQFCYESKKKYGGESHNFYELIYISDGEVEIYDNKICYYLKQGQGFIHQPNAFHSIKTLQNPAKSIIVSFNSDIDLENLTNTVIDFNDYQKTYLQMIISEAPAVFELPLDIIEQDKLVLKKDYPAYSLQYLRNNIENLIISISRTSKGSINIHNDQKRIIADQILEYLHSNIYRNITINGIAKSIGYSGSYIKQIFKNFLGKGIINYFNDLKIQEAKKLLILQKYRITEIANLLGFDNVQYFSCMFKKMTNTTPSKFQKGAIG